MELNGSGAGPPAIPDHELLRRIGRGSYGEVWLARNATGTLRAVKIVYRSSFDDDRPYEREFTGLKNFEPLSRAHEGLVDVLQIGRNDDGGFFYYVMELADDGGEALSPKAKPQSAPGQTRERVPGTPVLDVGARTFDRKKFVPLTLESRIRNEGRLPVKECVRISATLADALHFLHGAGLVHRDIKPSNIIFAGGVPKLADVGLVAQANNAHTFVGTEGFVPPEGPGSPRADIYSLGKCLYEMAMGKDRQAFPSPPTLLDELPDRAELLELNEVITKACEPDPGRRYQSAATFRKDLAVLAQGHSLRGATRRRKAARRVGVLAVVGAMVATVLWLVPRMHRPASPPPPNSPPRGGETVPDDSASAKSVLPSLALVSSFAFSTNCNAMAEGIADYEGDGLVRVLVLGPSNQLSLRAPDGSVLAQGEIPGGCSAKGSRVLVGATTTGQHKSIFLPWQTDSNAYLGRFNSRLEETRAFRQQVPASLHPHGNLKVVETGFFAYGLRPATNGAPPELLVVLQTGHEKRPREFRCYNATNATLLWTAPVAAVASLSPPLIDPGLGHGIVWIVGGHACGNGAELPDGETDSESCVRGLTADGRQLWRTNTGGYFSHCHPRLVTLPEGNAICALVQLGTDVAWQATNAVTPMGEILRVSPSGELIGTPYIPANRVELTGLEACDLDGDGRPELLATDAQGSLHVLNANLSPKQIMRVAPRPLSSDHRIAFSLAPPADLDGDGQPELVFLHEDVEFIDGRNYGNNDQPNHRLHRRITVTVYDHNLVPRAEEPIKAGMFNAGHQLVIAPKGRDGTRPIVVIGPTEVRFYRYNP